MKKYIILALVALLAAVLFVACDNDVKVDNNTAYTEVLESEGAFVVNGKSYDTLQSAIQAAVDGKTSANHVVITMTRNITSRPVVIPEDSEIELDLGGHKLTFIDVETSAFSVVSDVYDQSTSFSLKNGTVALLENSNDRNVIEVKATGEVYSFVCAVLSGVTVNGNISVYGGEEGDVELWVDSETKVNGKVKAEGNTPLDPEGSPWNDANVTLYVSSKLNDVEMTNVYLDVERFGHVVLTALGGGNYIVATDPDTAITNETEEEINVYGGVCYIDREEGVSYYGSLQAALDDLDADNLTIIFRDGYNKPGLAVKAGAGRPVIIDLNDCNVTVASIRADAALTIVNSRDLATFTGNITAAGTFLVNRNVDEDGFGKVVINGAVTAGGLGIDAFNAEFNGAIETKGRVEVVGCTVNGDVSAEKSVSIGFSTISPAVEGIISIGSSEDISMVYVVFDYEDLGSVGVVADKGGNISMTGCTGYVDAIIARNEAGSEPGTITIDNSESEDGTLTTGVIFSKDTAETSAKYGNISIYGYNTDKIIVSGPVAGATVTAEGATFFGNITATGLISISNSTVGPNGDEDLTISTSAEDEVDGLSVVPAISMTNTSFVRKYIDEDVYAYVDVVTKAGGSILLDNCSGYADDVTSLKSLTISNITTEFNVNDIRTEDLTVTYYTTGLNAASVLITGSGESSISAGNFGNFTYNGTGTLTVTGGNFNGATEFLNGSSIVLNGTYSGSGDGVALSSNYSLFFDDINAVTDNVHIKSAYIRENSLADVEKLVHRINQNGSGQQIYINYNRYGIENLTGVDNVFDMTSANIQSAGSACLNYTMYETDVYDTDNVVTSGLIVGKNDSTPASATFNYNNGSGKNQLVVTGKIGLLAGGNVIYSTQLDDDLVYGCTYELVDDNEGTDDDVYGYVIRDDVYGVASMAGYYEYRNGN